MTLTSSLVNPHWRKRLLDVQDLVIVEREPEDLPTTVQDLRKALLQLTAVLQDEWDGQTYPIVQLVQLVREAHDAFTNPNSPVNLKDWAKAAEPFLKG